MDENNDGKVSFGEVSAFTQDYDKFESWMYDVETNLQDEIQEEYGMCFIITLHILLRSNFKK